MEKPRSRREKACCLGADSSRYLQFDGSETDPMMLCGPIVVDALVYIDVIKEKRSINSAILTFPSLTLAYMSSFLEPL